MTGPEPDLSNPLIVQSDCTVLLEVRAPLAELGGPEPPVTGRGGSRLHGDTAELLASLANWNTVVSGEAVALAVLFSLTVSVFFGIWPARRAAKLDPIAALRYE